MSKYDFETIIDRKNFGSIKWNAFPDTSTEYVPLSTADMEFPTAPEIVETIKDVAENRVLGYTEPTDEYYDAVISWMKRKISRKRTEISEMRIHGKIRHKRIWI